MSNIKKNKKTTVKKPQTGVFIKKFILPKFKHKSSYEELNPETIGIELANKSVSSEKHILFTSK